MYTILDGKATAAVRRQKLAEQTRIMLDSGKPVPGLAVILVGEDPASAVYVRNKCRACEEIGFLSRTYQLPCDTSEKDLLALIATLNCDDSIDGILVQLPLPQSIRQAAVIEAIAPEKDVDAFHPENLGLLFQGTPRFMPCTPAGILVLLDSYHIPLRGKHCVVVGRSNIVGKPLSQLLLARDATVTVCHSKTEDLPSFTRQADLLISAVGKAGLITQDMIKEGAVVVDVGMNRNESGKLCGDVAFETVAPHCSFITPVPGGVGPMTIAMLMENTMTAALHRRYAH